MSTAPVKKDIVVIGAGVSGLTTALLLAENEKLAGAKITVLAKHMPGDYDIEYCSPWAGANYLPVGKPGTPHQTFERDTWPELERLARGHPESGIHLQESALHRRAKDKDSAIGEWFAELLKEDAWFKDVVPNFRVLDKSELPAGVDGGTRFTSVCINTAIYLPYLTSRLLELGVVFKRAVLSDIASAAISVGDTPADLVINCTGLGSLTLGGVKDTAMYPARGQIAIVRNEADGFMYSTSGTDDGDDEAMYIMQRAAGGGTVLGGCLQANSWESQPDPNLAIRIMQRAIKACPSLVPPGKGIEALSVIRHAVGLRPMRKGGMRVEKEVVDGVDVVHNYGHGGYGYQTSYGCAQEVVRLVLGGKS